MKRRMILGALALILCILPVRAEEVQVPGLEEVWRQTEAYGIGARTEFGAGVSGLLAEGGDQMQNLVGRGSGTAMKLMAVVLLCALAQGAQGPGKGTQAVRMAGALTITALTMTDVDQLIGMGRETIGRMGLLSEAVLPVMAVLSAATGAVGSAAVRQGVTVLFSQLLLTAMDRLLIPLIYAYVMTCCAAAAMDAPGLDKLAGLLKGAAGGILTVLLLAFVGYLTASGAVAGSVDASAVKAARMAITRAIPVVGGILADASETVLAGTGVLRSSVGAAGMLTVLAMCLTPFLQLGVQYLCYKVTAALCAMVAQPELSRLIDAIGGAFGLILGMTGAAGLILLISLVSALTAVIP